MKYLSIVLLIFLISCGESPCAKKAREKKEAEAALAAKQNEIPVAVEQPKVVEEKEANADKGLPHEAAPHKISERVCVLNQWSGTILDVRWSTKIEGLLVYNVQYLNETKEIVEGEFFDTEFSIGNCSGF